MKINFSDLAQIIQAIRDTEEFDGKNDIHEFMDNLDEYGEINVNIERIHGVTVFKIEGLEEE